MAMSSNTAIKTFSVGFKERQYNELPYARIIADRFRTEHHEMIVEQESLDLLPKLVSAYDEPFADNSAIPTYLVSRFAREHVTVALSGDGGDEVFAGYSQYCRMAALNKLKFTNSNLFKHAFSFINGSLPDYMYGKGYSYYLSKDKNHLGAYYCIWRDYERYQMYNPDLRKLLTGRIAPELYKINLLAEMNGEYLSKIQRLDVLTYLVDDILTKVDRASMLNSLEVRSPLLDHRLAELSFRMPSKLKLNGTVHKYILKKAMQPYLPQKIMNHPKQGFAIPLDYWFRDDLKDYAHDTLLNSLNLSDFLDMKGVRMILYNHQKGLRDYGDKIWALIFLNEWLRQN